MALEVDPECPGDDGGTDDDGGVAGDGGVDLPPGCE